MSWEADPPENLRRYRAKATNSVGHPHKQGSGKGRLQESKQLHRLSTMLLYLRSMKQKDWKDVKNWTERQG